ncbi:MAG: HAD-IC family P-type ATPase [Ruminococcus sp.]|nr:HAD-IC family P-type ATPase [Ruminococcus sp.]
MSNDKFRIEGLSSFDVEKRKKEGKVNISSNLKTKSIKRIFYDNIVTLFNLINVVLFVALLLVGSYKNMLFIGVMLFNIAIGIFQEIRSKRSVDKLSILSERKITVVRDGTEQYIAREDIVLDDIIVLSRGSQVPADCVLVSGECKVNESLLTGESDLMLKKVNNEMLSGSFISSGKCYARVTKVGADCYAAKINAEAKYIKKVNSQILKSFNFIIKLCTFVMFPIGVFFFINQFGIENGNIQQTVISTVAALIGMIPKGMILLTSSVLAVSIIRLSKSKVLVQEMYCIETLARVDVLCLDKTGTLTADEMYVTDVISFGSNDEEIKTALSSIVGASEEINATLDAIKEYTKGIAPLKSTAFSQFSSETKWSGGCFENGKTYIIGAAEFVFNDRAKYQKIFNKLDEINQTVRILVLAVSKQKINNSTLPDDLKPLAFVLIKDKLRDNVNETINYFKEQGVTLKVISGDSVKTVQNIAKEVGIPGAENAVDMSTITTDEQLEKAAESCNVFGRVTPAQKKSLVLALKKNNHSVAMTGDGVNDVLALKEADCSIAMASGSDAARNVSQLVLVNNDFASMPSVVAEGRRTINNIERSSALYLVKTIYSIILSILFIFFNTQYPFEPIQLTLIGAFTVAIPSFVLALQPNNNRIKGNFTAKIFACAIPSALCVILNIIAVICTRNLFGVASDNELSTISVFLTALSCFLLVVRLSLPINLLRGAMLAVSVGGVVLGSLFFSELFSIVPLSFEGMIMLVVLGALTLILFNIMYTLCRNLIKKLDK